jgi:hypothetical protein
MKLEAEDKFVAMVNVKRSPSCGYPTLRPALCSQA